jgi:hypothetical protein
MVKGVGCQGSRAGVATWIAADQSRSRRGTRTAPIVVAAAIPSRPSRRRPTCRPAPLSVPASSRRLLSSWPPDGRLAVLRVVDRYLSIERAHAAPASLHPDIGSLPCSSTTRALIARSPRVDDPREGGAKRPHGFSVPRPPLAPCLRLIRTIHHLGGGAPFGCAAAGDSGSAARGRGGNGAGSPGK